MASVPGSRLRHNAEVTRPPTADALRAARLRSHRLSAPAATPMDAARHLLAVQSQDFVAGRWALAVRSAGAPTLADVDALFDSGRLVRSWTMRGTIHTVPAADLGWMLEVTAQRQLAAGASRRRQLEIDEPVVSRAEQLLRSALRGGEGLSRAEAFAVLERAGIGTGAQRGLHLLHTLCVRGVLCQGPVVHRREGATREQRFVLVEEHITGSARPVDPPAELFVRYIAGHGPAGTADFAWWTGLTLTAARDAAERAGDRLTRIGDDLFDAPPHPRRSARAPRLVALGPFDEYYISYVDRTVACPPEHLATVGPGKNGMVRAVLVADGRVVGAWTHSTAVGRRGDAPLPEMFEPDAASDSEITAALGRYAAFVAG